MSKRTETTSAKDNPQNFWPIPPEATEKLAQHLAEPVVYVEPCAGDGAIVKVLHNAGSYCLYAGDVNPRWHGVIEGDFKSAPETEMIITNPPYDWKMLQPMLEHWIANRECWLLLPWDMLCNKRMNKYARYVDQIIPLGRVSWMGNGKAGMENSGWFHFATSQQSVILER